jgi:single stranded DNA-binding protein
MNINTVHITDDPERRYTPSGKAVASASIANNEHYIDAQGEEKKVTTFVNLQIWGKPAENFGNLAKKGQEIFVDGKLRMDEWTDKHTNTRRTRLYLLVENWQFTQYRRKEEALPRLPLPPLPPIQWPPTRKRPRREPSNSVTGTEGVSTTPGTMQTTHLNP